MNRILVSNVDLRNCLRANLLIYSMVTTKEFCVARFSANRAEAVAAYRFLGNQKVSPNSLIEAITHKATSKMKPGEHYLAIEDTTQLNFNKHKKRLKKNTLGVIGDNKSLGFFLHPVLLVGILWGPIGYGAIEIMDRPVDRDPNKKANRKNLPIEEKESYRWIKASQDINNKNINNSTVTYVCDREASFHQMFDRIPGEYAHILIRLKGKRILKTGNTEQILLEAPLKGTKQIEIRGDIRKNTTSRQAKLEIRFVKVTLEPKGKEIQADGTKVTPNPVEVYLIEAKEVNSDVATPIHWVLVTTHPIETLEQAEECIGWYEERWYIETLFRLLKKEGFKFENSELTTGDALKKQIILGLEASLQIMMLYIGYKKKSQAPIENIFNHIEVKAIEILTRKYEGKTTKQKNPYPKGTVSWGAWTIARMGGWKGYETQRPPGVLTFFEGLKLFNNMLQGREALEELTTFKT